MTGEIIMMSYGLVAIATSAACAFISWCFSLNKPKGTFEGGLNKTEFERLMQLKHGDNWQALLEAWQLGDE